MKLLLVNIYPLNTFARYLLSSYTLKAYFDANWKSAERVTVRVLNFSATVDSEKICQNIMAEQPDCIGYSAYIWNIEKILDVIRTLREKGSYIHILGGPEISINKIKKLQDPKIADYYVIGEGEKILLNLMDYIRNKSRGAEPILPNGVAVSFENDIAYTIPTHDERIRDLDEIPSVYLSGVIDGVLYERQQAFLETQRGCPFHCAYCVYHKNLSRISSSSLERVYSELEHLIVRKRVLALRIFDSVFTHDLPRAKKIVRFLIELKAREGVRIPWIYWEFTYQAVDDEFLRLTASLKYKEKILNTSEIKPLNRPQLYREVVKDYTVVNCVGIQSFCQDALRAVGRAPIDIERFTRFFKDVNKYNIVLKVDMILGLPFETLDSYCKGLELLLPFFKDTDHILNIHRLQILSESELERKCGIYGIRYSHKAPYTVYSTNSFSKKDMDHASKLTALLFRIVNSPLRGAYFSMCERSKKGFLKIISALCERIKAEETFKHTRFVNDDSLDDDYWNDEVFKEIASEWIIGRCSQYALDSAIS